MTVSTGTMIRQRSMAIAFTRMYRSDSERPTQVGREIPAGSGQIRCYSAQ